MAITDEMIHSATKELFSRALRKVPEDAKSALAKAMTTETNETARHTLELQLRSAELAEKKDRFVCSDSGVPVYFVKVGAKAELACDFKASIRAGYEDLVETIEPPMLKHVTNPLTLERGYHGKDMPIVSYDFESGLDYVEMICSPKALGSGRWAALELFTFPSIEEIETYILDVAIKAGAQHCPPVVMGVGIGGTFDHCAGLAKKQTLRPIGQTNPDPTVAAMEERLYKAVNSLGFGPMGTGGDTTVLGVHVDYSSGHGFTPVAVAFNCWINRRTSVKIWGDGRMEWGE
ncbi:fumarate hydratase [Antarctobacter sp.]|uniref:fumarate hydratase n=1 Tax=Antarctobacter sp. TaxID=1872577 RepID=UPI002B267DD7|nr:fumarate hydratase [Antarctobacter sp.]